jgi:hypothetical protein
MEKWPDEAELQRALSGQIIEIDFFAFLCDLCASVVIWN